MSKNLLNDLGIKVKGQKYRFVDSDLNFDENMTLPVGSNEMSNKPYKLDTLAENLNNNIKPQEESKIKQNVKKLLHHKAKESINDLTEKRNKLAENDITYKQLSEDISVYQSRVDKINNADVILFNQTNYKNQATLNTIKNQNKEMNQLELEIKEALIKNNYQTDDKILEQENNKLYNYVDPELIKKRYEELRNMRSLMYQQEIRNKHRNKIKSKLYHKIKKRQKTKLEEKILEQLTEVDPEAVKEYYEKKMSKRINERISLKHSMNKFNKTAKRYNFLYDPKLKESLMENYRNRDKLMEKVKNPYANDEDSDIGGEPGSDDEIEDSQNEEEENNESVEEEGDEEFEEDEDIENESQNKEEQIVKGNQILIDFNQKSNYTKGKKTGNSVFDMNFMKNSNEISKNVASILKKNKPDDDDISVNSNQEQTNSKEKIKNKVQFKLKAEKQELVKDKTEKSNGVMNYSSKIPSNSNILTSELIGNFADKYQVNKKTSYKLDLNEETKQELNNLSNFKDSDKYLKNILAENNEVST